MMTSRHFYIEDLIVGDHAGYPSEGIRQSKQTIPTLLLTRTIHSTNKNPPPPGPQRTHRHHPPLPHPLSHPIPNRNPRNRNQLLRPPPNPR